MVKAITRRSQQTLATNYARQTIICAAKAGSPLHQFYVDEQISEAQFQAGLALARLHSLAMRSFGIHNRIRTTCQSWDQLYGIVHDQFSSHKIEGLWRYILKALGPKYHQGLPMRNIAFFLILGHEIAKPYPQPYSLEQVRLCLSYLYVVWEKIEASPYRMGLFVYEAKLNPRQLR